MTASLFVIAQSVSPADRADDRAPEHPGRAAHAVAKPVVDGLEASVCGLLVHATAAQDWPSTPEAVRCEECARIAG